MICRTCKDRGRIPLLMPIKGKVFCAVKWKLCCDCKGSVRSPARGYVSKFDQPAQPIVVAPGASGALEAMRAVVRKLRIAPVGRWVR